MMIHFRAVVVLMAISIPSVCLSYVVVRPDGKEFSGDLIVSNSTETVIRDDQGVIVKFKHSQIDHDKTAEANKPVAPVLAPKQDSGAKDSKDRSFAACQTPDEVFSFELCGADLLDYFRFLADVCGMNLMADPSINQPVRINLTEITPYQAYNILCRTYGLQCSIDRNFLIVRKYGD